MRPRFALPACLAPVAVIALAAFAAPHPAAAEAGLIGFEEMPVADRDEAEAAHADLEAANARMCAIMVKAYADHVARVAGADLPPESAAFLERRCAARAFADHVALSLEMHDLIHDHAHAHAHDADD